MHTQQLITDLLDALGFSYEVDRFDGQVLTGYGLECEGQLYPVLLTLSPEATRIQVRSHQIAGTGGPEGRFDPSLAALVAVLAYEHDLQLGVDLRDGEIEAGLGIELAGVDPPLQPQLLKRAFKRFLFRLNRAARDLLGYREYAAAADAGGDVGAFLGQPLDLSA